ncbi:MAG: cytochrome c biogenesis protein ResB [Actinomycetota bacterium]
MSQQAHSLTLRQSLALVWRTLRSMRTALILLLFLAAAAIAGSLVPQADVSPLRVESIFRDHPLRARIYDALGLFHVYGSLWFTLIYSLLLLSLAACLFPRTRALIRNVRAKPQPAHELEMMRHYAVRTVVAPPAEVIPSSRRVLKRRLFRVSVADGAVAADKGLAREAGSLLFHWSFFLVLIGIIYGKGTGFTGQAVVAEGQTWVEAHANYDGNIREGAFFNGQHTGIGVHVENFSATFHPDGIPSDFVTRAQILDPDGNVERTVDIRVNHPVSVDGLHIYQFGYGWAPVIDVTQNGTPLATGPVVFQQPQAPAGVDQSTIPWNGVVKLPSMHPQVGIELQLWPDGRGLASVLAGGSPVSMRDAFHPVITYTAYRGNLHAGQLQNIATLDTTDMRKFQQGLLRSGVAANLGNGLSVSFPELRQYTVLQVSRDRGLPIMLIAAVLILLGLLPALYTSRRRLWVRAEAGRNGTVLQVAGFALQRKEQFEEEFAHVVDDLERAAGGPPPTPEAPLPAATSVASGVDGDVTP